jgi:hypothetical protein
VDPVPDPLLRKCGSTGNRTRDLWICSQALRPLDLGWSSDSVVFAENVSFPRESLMLFVSTSVNVHALPLPAMDCILIVASVRGPVG